MPVEALSNNASSGTGATAPNRFSDLSSEQFLKIIFTELQKQDPLQPNDSSKLLEQLSSIRSIQSDIELSGQLKSIVTQNQLASAGAMIGNYVSGLDENNVRVIGQVASVSRTKDGPVLNLSNGARVRFDQVDEMALPPRSNNSGGTGNTGGAGGTGAQTNETGGTTGTDTGAGTTTGNDSTNGSTGSGTQPGGTSADPA